MAYVFLTRIALAVAVGAGMTVPASNVAAQAGSACFATGSGSDEKIAACTQLIETEIQSGRESTAAYLGRGNAF